MNMTEQGSMTENETRDDGDNPAAIDDTAATAETPEPAASARIAELEAELDEARNALLYERAETQNVRRRAERERQEAQLYAATSFARDILSVADNLARALDAIPAELRADEKMKGLVVGLEATGRELESIFARHGITRIAALGEPLDPNRHSAMMELESDAAPGTIVQEIQPGYMIRDRLLRPTMVAVAKAPAAA